MALIVAELNHYTYYQSIIPNREYIVYDTSDLSKETVMGSYIKYAYTIGVRFVNICGSLHDGLFMSRLLYDGDSFIDFDGRESCMHFNNVTKTLSVLADGVLFELIVDTSKYIAVEINTGFFALYDVDVWEDRVLVARADLKFRFKDMPMCLEFGRVNIIAGVQCSKSEFKRRLAIC